jgi:hypothetical protein
MNKLFIIIEKKVHLTSLNYFENPSTILKTQFTRRNGKTKFLDFFNFWTYRIYLPERIT